MRKRECETPIAIAAKEAAPDIAHTVLIRDSIQELGRVRLSQTKSDLGPTTSSDTVAGNDITTQKEMETQHTKIGKTKTAHAIDGSAG